ncbi:hypothetical protein K435DRAFT_721816 [Dendrothele bispora CBS 962.96]|uniref:Uncharacterized protein n=1 Tax=Dendrothele bispora (strain CBS 962.96) TaxID=1314807 RepID=A0A4S8M5K6_DENBC|nr:hypothetical protein K435DRAFT_721816 [Dendrothele bispora CBS 962.96]
MSPDSSELPPAYASLESRPHNDSPRVESDSFGQPPAYFNPTNDSVSSTSSSSYRLPSSFAIGSKTIPQLVSIAEVQGHLALLNAFAEFRTKVGGLLGGDASEYISVSSLMPEDKEKRWSWFIGLAVERFERWCKALEPSDADVDEDIFLDKFLPPVDVLMIWHSYLLNPAWYLEDAKRVPSLRNLRRLGVCFANVLPKLSFYLISFSASDSKMRLATWTSRTQTDFDPFESATTLTEREVVCPACLLPVVVQLTKPDGTGYLQSAFSQTCTNPSCNHPITKGSLGIRRMLVDLTRNVGEKATEEFQTYMAGSLFRPGTMYDTTRGDIVKRNILASTKLKRPANCGSEREWQDGIMKKVGWNMKEMRKAMSEELKGIGEKLITRVIGAYSDDRIFSIDLIGATLRQGSFISKMQSFGWTSPRYLTGSNEVVLHHAVARYHAFLDLMVTNPTSMIVPTLDIDLVWHTHQLLARKYRKDCSTLLGKFLDHDDKVEEGRLALSFELTTKLWQDRFGLPYVYCGCPISGETIGQKLTRIVGIQSSMKHRYLEPPAELPEARNGTHPSDHNSVYALHMKKQGDSGRRERTAKYAKGLKKAEKGKDKAEDTGTKIQGQSGDSKWLHSQPFLVPIPMTLKDDASAVASQGCMATVSDVVNGSEGAGGLLCAVGTGICSPGGAACGAAAGCGPRFRPQGGCAVAYA